MSTITIGLQHRRAPKREIGDSAPSRRDDLGAGGGERAGRLNDGRVAHNYCAKRARSGWVDATIKDRRAVECAQRERRSRVATTAAVVVVGAHADSSGCARARRHDDKRPVIRPKN